MKIKDGTIDLGPMIPVAIPWKALYPPCTPGRLDIFRGFRVSKSFVMFQNFDRLWTLANGHGLVGPGMNTPGTAYDLAQELEALPIDWSIQTKRFDPHVGNITKPVIQSYKDRGLL
jgi:hypothetical protein